MCYVVVQSLTIVVLIMRASTLSPPIVYEFVQKFPTLSETTLFKTTVVQ